MNSISCNACGFLKLNRHKKAHLQHIHFLNITKNDDSHSISSHNLYTYTASVYAFEMEEFQGFVWPSFSKSYRNKNQQICSTHSEISLIKHWLPQLLFFPVFLLVCALTTFVWMPTNESFCPIIRHPIIGGKFNQFSTVQLLITKLKIELTSFHLMFFSRCCSLSLSLFLVRYSLSIGLHLNGHCHIQLNTIYLPFYTAHFWYATNGPNLIGEKLNRISRDFSLFFSFVLPLPNHMHERFKLAFNVCWTAIASEIEK